MPVHLQCRDNLLVRTSSLKQGPLLFCVPAFACTGADYLPLMSTTLADQFRIVTVDLPGLGASPPREDVRCMAGFADLIASVADHYAEGQRVLLMAHSVSSPIVVEALHRNDLRHPLISIEGNLLDVDAYASGQAAKFDEAEAFKQAFLDDLWQKGTDTPIFRHFHAAAHQADAETIWYLGRDVVVQGPGDRFGRRMRALTSPVLYCWSEETTPPETRTWLEASGLAHHQYATPTHWPMVEAPAELAAAICAFWDRIESI